MLLLVKLRTKFSFFSPLVVFYMFFLMAIVFSICYHFLMPSTWKFSIAKVDDISDKDFWVVITIFVRMIIYFSIGVLTYKYFFNIHKNSNSGFNFKIKLPNISFNPIVILSFIIFLIDIILVWILYGKEIFIRNSYSVDFNTFGIMLLEYSLLFLIFLGGFLFKKRKEISILIAFFVTLLCIGFGSRMATIYLLVYFFVIFVLYMTKKEKIIFITLGSPFILLFFGYNISLRFEDQHGLIPYLLMPFSNSQEILINTIFNLYYTLIFGVFATFKTLAENISNYSYLITSLNPAPGFTTDWYSIYKKLRINHYAPFTAIGEVFTYPIFAFFFYFIVGFFFTYSEKLIHKLFRKNKIVIGFIIFILTCAFIPYSFEYNLRSSIRFLYYAMIFIIVQNFFSRFKFKI